VRVALKILEDLRHECVHTTSQHVAGVASGANRKTR
jgi:hypothetical protein